MLAVTALKLNIKPDQFFPDGITAIIFWKFSIFTDCFTFLSKCTGSQVKLADILSESSPHLYSRTSGEFLKPSISGLLME